MIGEIFNFQYVISGVLFLTNSTEIYFFALVRKIERTINWTEKWIITHGGRKDQNRHPPGIKSCVRQDDSLS